MKKRKKRGLLNLIVVQFLNEIFQTARLSFEQQWPSSKFRRENPFSEKRPLETVLATDNSNTRYERLKISGK